MRTITDANALAWFSNKTKNPKYNTDILVNGPTYKAYKLRYNQVIGTEAEKEAIFNAQQEEEALETREKALRIFMLSNKDKLSATKLAATNRSLMEYFNEINKSSRAPPDPLNIDNVDEYVKTYLVYNNYNNVRISLDDDAKKHLISIINNVISKIHKIVKPVKSNPKNHEKYIGSIISLIKRNPSIVNNLYTSLKERSYRSVLKTYFFNIYYTMIELLLNSDETLNTDYKPFLMRPIHDRYDVNEFAALVMAAYADASMEQVIASAISRHGIPSTNTRQSLVLQREDFA